MVALSVPVPFVSVVACVLVDVPAWVVIFDCLSVDCDVWMSSVMPDTSLTPVVKPVDAPESAVVGEAEPTVVSPTGRQSVSSVSNTVIKTNHSFSLFRDLYNTYVNSFTAGNVFIRQNLTSIDVRW